MMMLRSAFLLSLPLMLVSCGLTDRGTYVPEYLKPDSPLDPPGTSAARAAMRAEILKEGKYPADAEAPVREGKVFLLERNPDRDESTDGKLVRTPSVKVIACEGTYYFVETQEGERGFVRESDLEDPVTLVSNGLTDPVTGLPLTPGGEAQLPSPESNASAVQPTDRVTVSSTGRAVILRSNGSDRAAAYEQRRREAAGQPSAAEGGDVDFEPLPEPSGSSQN